MYPKDSTRFFEQFGEMLSQLIDLKKKGTFHDADKLLTQSFERFLSINPDVFDDITPHKIIDFLLANYTYNITQLSVLAELLKERGELSYHRGDKHFTMFNYNLALNILEFVEHEVKLPSMERMEKIIWLQQQVALMLEKIAN